MNCACGHRRHHHAAGRICHTLTIGGPATPPAYLGAAAELHMGRSLNYCGCSQYQPGTGDQVQPTTRENP